MSCHHNVSRGTDLYAKKRDRGGVGLEYLHYRNRYINKQDADAVVSDVPFLF